MPSLIGVAATTILTSWWYSRKIKVQVPTVTLSQVWQEASALLKLGFAFMASGMMTLGVAYVVRITVLHKIGIEATGLYQSAWTLGGLYVGFILQAMGADFYPRLTASIHNHANANRLVNEQTLIGLLLAGPGVLATLTFAPLVIALFYSAKFGAAVDRPTLDLSGRHAASDYMADGLHHRSQRQAGLFFFAELAWAIVAAGLAWVCIKSYGLNGAGIAFFGSYVFHAFLIYPIVRRLTGFRWSAQNTRTGVVFLALIGLVFGGFYVMPLLWAAGIGAVAAVASSIYSIRVLLKARSPRSPSSSDSPLNAHIWITSFSRAEVVTKFTNCSLKSKRV